MTTETVTARRPIALAIAAALAVVAAFAGVLVLGALRPPAFPSLADTPDPGIAGTVAFWDADGSGCLSTVAAGGGPVRELRCDPDTYASALEWTADGNLRFERYARSGEERVTVDARTGEVLQQEFVTEPQAEPLPLPDRAEGPDGTQAVLDGADGTAVLRLVAESGEPRTLLEATGPRDYAFYEVTWAPDGAWLLVTDSEQRLLVVDAETGDARLLTTDASLPAWSSA